MRNAVRGVGLLLGVLAMAAAVQAQADRGARPAAPPPPPANSDVHQMTILNGTNRTVHYFANNNVSPGDSMTLKDLERAENEMSYAQNQEALKREYIHSERILEKVRRYVQEQLYGRSVSSSAVGPFAYSSNFGGRFGVGAGYPLGFPLGGYGGFGGFGAMIGGATSSETQNLAFGTGYEGPIKEAVAQTIGREATPEFTASVFRNYGGAVARAANSPVLRDSLALGQPARGRPETVQEAAFGRTIPGGPTFQTGRPVTLTLRGGGTVEGTVVGEDPEWVTVETANSVVNVRKNEVVKGEQKKAESKTPEPKK